MRLAYLAFALTAWMAASVPALAGDGIAREQAVVDGKTRAYYVYAPPGTDGKVSPLLLLLHGSGSDGLYMTGLWKADADREGIVLLAPNADNTDAWRLTKDTPDILRSLIETVSAHHSIDPKRIYVFGQSGGAVYALTLAMLESEYFAAVAIHAGAWRTPAEFKAMQFARRKIPLAIIVGDRDEYFSLIAVRKTVDALASAGFPVETTIVPGQHHPYFAEVAPGINATAWSFLKSKTLERAPLFIDYPL